MFSSSEKSHLWMEAEYLQQKHNVTGNNFTCTVKQEDCECPGITGKVCHGLCFVLVAQTMSACQVYLGPTQFQGSLWPKPNRNLRKELGGRALASVSQCSSPVHISGEAGPGSVPGTVVQSQSKRRGHQWPSQLQRELRAWLKTAMTLPSIKSAKMLATALRVLTTSGWKRWRRYKPLDIKYSGNQEISIHLLFRKHHIFIIYSHIF